MSLNPKPPSQPRYERVRKFLDSELYFQARISGKPITIVKPSGEPVSYPAEVVGVTNYIHANYDTDLLIMAKASITDIAEKLIESGDWKKHLPPATKPFPASSRKEPANGDGATAPAKVKAPKAPKAKIKKSKPKPKVYEKKSDAPSATPRATEPEVGASGEVVSGGSAALEITANHQPPAVAVLAPQVESGEAGRSEKAPEEDVEELTIPDEPEPAPVPAQRSGRMGAGRPARRALPHCEWTIPVISLLIGAEQIVEAHDTRPGSEKRLAALRGLAEEYQQIVESRPSRGETSSK